MRLKRLSECGSIACLVERPPWETQTEQNSDIVLKPLNCRICGGSQPCSRGEFQKNTLRALPGSFQKNFGISSGKSQPHWEYSLNMRSVALHGCSSTVLWRRTEHGVGQHGSNTELSEFFALTELRGGSSVSSFQPVVCVPKRAHRVVRRLSEFGAELSEFSLPKQYYRNSIPPIS